MGFFQVCLEVSTQQVLAHPLTSIIISASCFLIARSICRIFFHPLARLPGPLISKVTSSWLYYHTYIGDEASVIHRLHKLYGPILRIAPNRVDIGDAAAVQPIYVLQGGFPKARCYSNFDIDGHATIFSTLDPAYRTPRARAVLPMFSTASIRANISKICDCVDRMIARLQSEKAIGRPVNVLNLTRSLAVDIVSTHLFELNYNGTEERTERLSVSAFVDAFVAVGRFFYLPTIVFIWLERVMGRLMPDPRAHVSMDLVERFVDGLVDQATESSTNYPGRLTQAGLVRSEIKAQCKDLIFAGTDSTGMNLATICRYLSMNQTWLETVRLELYNNRTSSNGVEIQALPYLTATIKEATRLSMANPTRLPHTVPSGGWTFKSTHFPPGADVGCSAYELHLNPVAFPEPTKFKPERWMTDDPQVRDLMNQHWFVFGAGSRACIARNLAMTELYVATARLVESGALQGAVPCQDRVEIYEWFNSSVKGDKIELAWPTIEEKD
ncbi:MAG: hypothetical protein M1818_001069 [Claussenomyces sp. TS43310]|nr:MAG: hypothetical protein M1818_001069 [Claussenomyces sp. TS43310]